MTSRVAAKLQRLFHHSGRGNQHTVYSHILRSRELCDKAASQSPGQGSAQRQPQEKPEKWFCPGWGAGGDETRGSECPTFDQGTARPCFPSLSELGVRCQGGG